MKIFSTLSFFLNTHNMHWDAPFECDKFNADCCSRNISTPLCNIFFSVSSPIVYVLWKQHAIANNSTFLLNKLTIYRIFPFRFFTYFPPFSHSLAIFLLFSASSGTHSCHTHETRSFSFIVAAHLFIFFFPLSLSFSTL